MGAHTADNPLDNPDGRRILVTQHIPLPREIVPDQVHEPLGRHVLADGFRLVYDTRASRGSWVQKAQMDVAGLTPDHEFRL
jgi:hypothetical protein